MELTHIQWNISPNNQLTKANPTIKETSLLYAAKILLILKHTMTEGQNMHKIY